MGQHFDLLVVGDYCLDLVFTGLASLPQLGQEIVGEGFDQMPGGAFTTAVAAHRLGLSVGWACDFGCDSYSQFALEKAREESLPEDLFIHHKRPMRNVTVSLSYEQERAFIAYYDPPPILPAGFAALTRACFQVIMVPGIYSGGLFEASMRIIRSRNAKLVMDGNSGGNLTLENPAIRRAISCTDVFMPNASEALRLTKETDIVSAARGLARLCPLVVIKDGSRGSLACVGDEVFTSPAIKVKPIDTTGAGDCFNAGFLRAWINARPIEECLLWGNVVGGLSTLARGGTGRVIRDPEVLEWIDRLPRGR